MSETTNKDDAKKPLSLSRPGKLELKKTVATGQVRQSFSHGRSKTVTVEVKKRRTFARDSGGQMAEVQQPAAEAEPVEKPVEAPPRQDKVESDAMALTDAERAARARALQDALDNPPPAKEKKAEAPPPGEDIAAQQLAGGEVEGKRARPVAFTPAAKAAPAGKPAAEEESAAAKSKRGRPDAKRPTPTPTPRRGEPRRRAGKLTINEALAQGEGEERVRSLASVKRQRQREKERARELQQEHGKVVREVVIPESITVQELANRMAERGSEVVRWLMKAGTMANVNQVIDADTAELIVAEFGHRVKRVAEADVEVGIDSSIDSEDMLVPRPPVVTVMGHVDHGKTSLLDAMRESDVAAREAGGITQHIGAYQIVLSGGARITFLDTPGHEAFTAMRARGASVTDIVVLVVAADDSVQPQTIEAIAHAKAAEVPIIVAVNKMDMPGANPDKVYQDLLNYEIVVEKMGGETLAIEVSAKEKTGLDKLEEAIILQAELLELKANPDRAAQGVVVEARLEQGRGAVATVLISRGTLRIGEIMVAGAEWGRVRALNDYRGNKITEAGPGEPVEVLGLNAAPSAGDEFAIVEHEAQAREISEYRQRQAKDKLIATGGRSTVEQMFSALGEGEVSQLAIVVKGDVQGSVEAMIGSLDKLATDEVAVRVLHSGVGSITESDVALAEASSGMV
ncbi:MAG: translation initiation factor IF-2, partial [Alphaproteobacteria bacterium]